MSASVWNPGSGSVSELTVALGGRDAVVYYDANSVQVFRNFATMSGFRYRGQYLKSIVPTFPMPGVKVASVSTGLGAESAACDFNWYAAFACANSNDSSAVIKTMPFLRAGAVSGNTVPLIKAGENIHTLDPQTYAWSDVNNLTGTDCLVITENARFSGRVATILSNASGQLTLDVPGQLAAYDFLLPAPPGYEHYVYLGSFYFEGEIRNIADTGIAVKAKMSAITDPNFTTSGAIPSAVKIHVGGYICPLATEVIVKDTHALSTASTGDHAMYFWSDSSLHEIASTYEKKVSTSTDTYVYDGIELPFAQWQEFYLKTDGSLAAARVSASLEIRGWIEP